MFRQIVWATGLILGLSSCIAPQVLGFGGSASPLPPGVTLQAPDGGGNYYGNNGYTNAHNAGWDSTVFPTGIWIAPVPAQSDVNRWLAMGVNLDVVPSLGTPSTDLALLRLNNITAIESLEPSFGPITPMASESVGLMVFDEPQFYNQAIVAPIGGLPQATFTGSVTGNVMTVTDIQSGTIIISQHQTGSLQNIFITATGITTASTFPTLSSGTSGTCGGGASCGGKGAYSLNQSFTVNPGSTITMSAIPGTASAIQDGRFFYMNGTWAYTIAAPAYEQDGAGLFGKSYVPNGLANQLTTPIKAPGNNTRHIDIISIDIYWFATHSDTSFWQGIGGQMYTAGTSGLSSDQMQRGNHYGDIIDVLRNRMVGAPGPLFSFIENGNGNTCVNYDIFPYEMDWAQWSVIIHGGRGVIYFNGDCAPAPSGYFGGDNFSNGYFQTASNYPGAGTSITSQATSTNLLVNTLMPLIVSNFAVGYVTPSPLGYQFPTATLSLNDGIDVMTKFFTGPQYVATTGDTISPGFYIFAGTRNSETESNISATFTIADKKATKANVINESRSVTITNGVFTDTFAKAWTTHIYQIVD